jgi:hypothetical protein
MQTKQNITPRNTAEQWPTLFERSISKNEKFKDIFRLAASGTHGGALFDVKRQ